MRTKRLVGVCSVAAVTLMLGPGLVQAQRREVRHEIREGEREIRHERREATREILEADSPWEVRHEIREGHREITHERREARREVRREIRKEFWDR